MRRLLERIAALPGTGEAVLFAVLGAFVVGACHGWSF